MLYKFIDNWFLGVGGSFMFYFSSHSLAVLISVVCFMVLDMGCRK